MSEWTIDKIEELTTELERTKCALAAQVDDTLNAIQSLRKAEVRAEEAETELTWYGEQWEAAALTVLGALGFPAWQQLPDPVDVAAGIRMLSAERDKAEARAERAEKERAELRHKLDCVPPNMGNACNQIDVLARQRNETQKANAALRAALKACVSASTMKLQEGCAHVVEGAWLNALNQAAAALADPNLGSDWVPRAELEAALAALAVAQAGEANYQVELRRVSESEKERP
jgi:chromosome segregation ATPase